MRQETRDVLELRAANADDDAVRSVEDAQNLEDRQDFVRAAEAWLQAWGWRERAASIRAAIKDATVL